MPTSMFSVKTALLLSNVIDVDLWPTTEGPPGPGGCNNLSNSVLESLLYFISPLH